MRLSNFDASFGSYVSRGAIAAALMLAAGGNLQAEPKTNLLHQWATAGGGLPATPRTR